MAPNEEGYRLLLRYAEASKHKLIVKNVAAAVGLAPNSASTRLTSSKKNKTDTKLSSSDVTKGLPVLIKYAEASDHKIVVKHFATAAGIAANTASVRLSKAKEAITSSATQSELGMTRTAEKKPIPKRNEKTAQNSKETGDAQADFEATTATTNNKPSLKRKLNASRDINVGIGEETPKNKKSNVSVVINTHRQASNNADVNDNSANATENTKTASIHVPTEEHEPPKKKRGRPPKKTKDEHSMPQANGVGEDGTPKSANSSPVSKDGIKAINDEHAAAIDAAAISSERSLALDGTTDTQKLKHNEKARRVEAPLVDEVHHLQTSAHGIAGEMLDADKFCAKTEETRSMSADLFGTYTAIEENIGTHSPEGTHDSLMDMYIDIEKGEGSINMEG